MVCIFHPACELLPPRKKDLYFTCVLLPLYCTISLTSFPLPPSQCTEYTDSVWLCWNVLWTIFCRSFTLCFWPDSPPQTKMTSKDDIKGFVSLKFLRLWEECTLLRVDRMYDTSIRYIPWHVEGRGMLPRPRTPQLWRGTWGWRRRRWSPRRPWTRVCCRSTAHVSGWRQTRAGTWTAAPHGTTLCV